MEPTFFGVIVLALGVLSLRRSVTAVLAIIVVCSALGASSALNLPALGGSSIPPAYFMMIFLAPRFASLMLNRDGAAGLFWSAGVNLPLLLFVAYGAFSAFVFPFVFEGQIAVTPPKGGWLGETLFYVEPLRFSPQNITQAVYLLGTLFVVLTTTLVVRVEQKEELLIRALLGVAWVHVAFGVADLVLYATGRGEMMSLVRNAGYAQLDQTVHGFHRIAGAFSETSGYCAYGFALLVFTTELWLRGVRPRDTGRVSLALVGMLVLSTSSSAYLGLSVYASLLGVRFLMGGVPAGKALLVAGCGLVATIAALLLQLLNPDFANLVIKVLQDMTVGKSQSQSGLQRAFWAHTGYRAFGFSHGVGIGVGSFRSSSLIAAVAGTMGVVGCVTFALYLLRIVGAALRPGGQAGTRTTPVSRAAGWAAVVGLTPAMFAAANPDPGLLFAIFAGMAMSGALMGERREPVATGGRLATPPIPAQGVAAAARLPRG